VRVPVSASAPPPPRSLLWGGVAATFLSLCLSLAFAAAPPCGRRAHARPPVRLRCGPLPVPAPSPEGGRRPRRRNPRRPVQDRRGRGLATADPGLAASSSSRAPFPPSRRSRARASSRGTQRPSSPVAPGDTIGVLRVTRLLEVLLNRFSPAPSRLDVTAAAFNAARRYIPRTGRRGRSGRRDRRLVSLPLFTFYLSSRGTASSVD